MVWGAGDGLTEPTWRAGLLSARTCGDAPHPGHERSGPGRGCRARSPDARVARRYAVGMGRQSILVIAVLALVFLGWAVWSWLDPSIAAAVPSRAEPNPDNAPALTTEIGPDRPVGEEARTVRTAPTVPDAVARPKRPSKAKGTLRIRALEATTRVPIAGLAIVVHPADRSSYAAAWEATTDATGCAVFADVDAGAVTTEPRAQTTRISVAPGVETEVELLLRRLRQVSGKVVDDQGRAAAGATVYVDYDFSGRGRVTHLITGSDGKFEVPTYGEWAWVHASKPGYVPSVARMVRQESSREPMVLTLGPGPGTIAGVVLDPDRKPVAHARISVRGSERGAIQPKSKAGDYHTMPQQLVQSDVEGRFQVHDVPPGSAWMFTKIDGYAYMMRTVEVPSGGIARVELVLSRGVRVFGTVRRPGGKPLEGATVGVGHRGMTDYVTTQTDEQGRYELVGVTPQASTVDAEHRDYFEASQLLAMRPGVREVRCDFELRPAHSLTGRLIDELEQPVPGYEILVDGEYQSRSVTDEAGRFELLHLEKRSYEVKARHKGSVQASETCEPPGSVVLRLDPQRRPSAWFTGRILDSDGKPVARGVTTTHGDGGKTQRSAMVDQHGAFRLGPLPPGTYEIRFWSEAVPAFTLGSFSIMPQEEQALGSFKVPRAAALTLWFRGLATADVLGAAYTIESADRKRGAAYGVVKIDEAIRVEKLVPGNYRLRVYGTKFIPDVRQFELSPDRDTVLEVQLQRGSQVTVSLEFGKGAKIPSHATLQVFDEAGESLIPFAPVYSMNHPQELTLRPGKYRVHATYMNETLGVAKFDVTPGKRVHVKIPIRDTRR